MACSPMWPFGRSVHVTNDFQCEWARCQLWREQTQALCHSSPTPNVHPGLSPTFPSTAPAMAINGVNPSSRRVSLQSRTKPMTKPAMKVVIHWMKMANLSPIPAWILLMSLWRLREQDKRRQMTIWKYCICSRISKMQHHNRLFLTRTICC